MTKLADELEVLGSRLRDASEIADWVHGNYNALITALREVDRLREAISSCIDMTVNCAGVPQNPDSLPQMVLHALRAALEPHQ